MNTSQISRNGFALLLLFNVGASLIVLRQYDQSLELTARAYQAVYSKAPVETTEVLPDLAMVKIEKRPRHLGGL